MRGFIDKERFDYLIPLPTRQRRKLAEVLEHTLAAFDKDVRPDEVCNRIRTYRCKHCSKECEFAASHPPDAI